MTFEADDLLVMSDSKEWTNRKHQEKFTVGMEQPAEFSECAELSEFAEQSTRRNSYRRG